MVMPKFGEEDLTQLFRAAKKRSVKTVLDVVTPPGSSLVTSGQLEAMLAYTDVFLPNNDEAEAMTGSEGSDRAGKFPVQPESNLRCRDHHGSARRCGLPRSGDD